MTRAQSWLIVCGAGEPAKDLSSWHDRIAAGIARAAGDGLKLEACTFPSGEGKRLSRGDWPADHPGEGVMASGETSPVVLPGWTLQPAPPPREDPGPISPSALGGAKALPENPGWMRRLRSSAARGFTCCSSTCRITPMRIGTACPTICWRWTTIPRLRQSGWPCSRRLGRSSKIRRLDSCSRRRHWRKCPSPRKSAGGGCSAPLTGS